MSSAPAILGRTLGGRFRVTGFIGEGAMASVYRAVQAAEPHDVALKIMHPHLISDATFVGRFKREAKAASRIDHPNTVRIVDCGVDGTFLYIAMELLAGQDLFETLVLERRLAEDRAVRIVLQVLDALVAAHDKGVVHRDLKPENIMLLRDEDDPDREDVKVLDFGIAKILEVETTTSSDGPPSAMSALTGVGTVVGTPAYMSPEQCRGEPIDTRSDIYACGVLLYQLVCGRVPFHSQNAMEVAVMHVRSPPTPPEEVAPGVNRQLSAIILKALSKWPAQRQQSASELRAELCTLKGQLSSTPLVLASPAPAGPSVPPLIRNHPAGSEPTAPLPASDPPRPLVALPEPDRRYSALEKTFDDLPGIAVPAPATPLEASKPRPVPNPVSAPMGARVREPLSRPAGRLVDSWIIVPFALFLGIAMGALAFFLARP